MMEKCMLARTKQITLGKSREFLMYVKLKLDTQPVSFIGSTFMDHVQALC